MSMLAVVLVVIAAVLQEKDERRFVRFGSPLNLECSDSAPRKKSGRKEKKQGLKKASSLMK